MTKLNAFATSNNKIRQTDSVVLFEITKTQLTKSAQSLNKKLAGLDDISLYLLKKCVPYMLKPSPELVDASIIEGIFPITLKN